MRKSVLPLSQPKIRGENSKFEKCCDSEREGGISATSPSAYHDARTYGGIVGGVHVDPRAPMADGDNFEDYYDEEDGFQKVKGKRGKG